MGYMYEDKKDKALEELRRTLRDGLGVNTLADNVLDALKNYVDEVVSEMRRDLTDQINKSGPYDPDY